jgi:ribonuclease HII
MWRNELRFARQAGWEGAIAGVDEAGRGPLAGPVVAAAAILPRRCYLSRLDDSKRLTGDRREELEPLVRKRAVACAVAVVSVERIDQINILRASWEAMVQAVSGLPDPPAGVLVDGLRVPLLGPRQVAVVDGDALCPSIAAASILAKVTRDRIMLQLDRQYPEYGFCRNKGYCTPEHLRVLRRRGPCPVHRKTFDWRRETLFDAAGENEVV